MPEVYLLIFKSVGSLLQCLWSGKRAYCFQSVHPPYGANHLECGGTSIAVGVGMASSWKVFLYSGDSSTLCPRDSSTLCPRYRGMSFTCIRGISVYRGMHVCR